jgi:hypothetical protein
MSILADLLAYSAVYPAKKKRLIKPFKAKINLRCIYSSYRAVNTFSFLF